MAYYDFIPYSTTEIEVKFVCLDCGKGIDEIVPVAYANMDANSIDTRHTVNYGDIQCFNCGKNYRFSTASCGDFEINEINNAKIYFPDFLERDLCGEKILDGYTIEKLKELYKKKIPIQEMEKEKYLSYMGHTKQKYDALNELLPYGKYVEGLMVSNHGNVIFNNEPLPKTFVKDGIHKGFYGGKYDNYLEINIPRIYRKYYVFLVHRLVAEVWCNNPYNYRIVHHIGNDNSNNSKNLIFLTEYQHNLVHHEY
jgi:hypothetical protein